MAKAKGKEKAKSAPDVPVAWKPPSPHQRRKQMVDQAADDLAREHPSVQDMRKKLKGKMSTAIHAALRSVKAS